MLNQSECLPIFSRAFSTDTSQFPCLKIELLMSVGVPSKAPVCSRSTLVIVGSTSAEGMDKRVFCR